VLLLVGFKTTLKPGPTAADTSSRQEARLRVSRTTALEVTELARAHKNAVQHPKPGAAAQHTKVSAAEPLEAARAAGPGRRKSDPTALILAPVFLVEVAWLLLLVYLGWRLLSTI
jgi:hypothetical protein